MWSLGKPSHIEVCLRKIWKMKCNTLKFVWLKKKTQMELPCRDFPASGRSGIVFWAFLQSLMLHTGTTKPLCCLLPPWKLEVVSCPRGGAFAGLVSCW